MSVMETLRAVSEEEVVPVSGVLLAVQTFLEEVQDLSEEIKHMYIYTLQIYRFFTFF